MQGTSFKHREVWKIDLADKERNLRAAQEALCPRITQGAGNRKYSAFDPDRS